MSTKELRGRVLQGRVVSSKMDKSIIVAVERRVTDPVYQKIMTRTKKVCVHDPENTCKEGDKVLVQETRPISKTKSWVLVSVLEQAS